MSVDSVPCSRRGGPIHDGENCVIEGPIYDLDSGRVFNRFEHLEGQCDR